MSRNIYYKGITSDTNKVIKECPICNIKINYKNKNKREISKLIIFKRPKFRYIGDLSDIPNELKAGTKFLHIFIIIDHFSKFLDAFLLEDKKKESILKYLDYFCKFYGYPLQFGCDNGREFINEKVSNYLNDNNIKMVNGKPYKPRSQGVVERVHRTIRNGLIAKFIENIKNFNLESSLKLVVNNYNRTVHSVTKFQPNEVFYSTDNELFKKVYNNIIDYYNKTQKNNVSYSINSKCILNNNIIKSNKKVKNRIILLKNAIKKNKSFYKICVIIHENLNGGLYLVKIVGDYDLVGIKHNEIYCVNFNLLIPCDIDIWEQFVLI